MSHRPAPGSRLLIAEEALKDHIGHWFGYASGVAKFNTAAGVATEVAIHAEVSPELEWSVPVHPIFARSYWDQGGYRRKPGLRRLLGICQSKFPG